MSINDGGGLSTLWSFWLGIDLVEYGTTASSRERCDTFFSFDLEEICDFVVGSDDELGVLKSRLPSFEFSIAGILVKPELEVVREAV